MASTSYVSVDKLESVTCDFYVFVYDRTKTRDETIAELKRRLGDKYATKAVFLLPYEPVPGKPLVGDWLRTTMALPNRDPSGTDLKKIYQTRAYQRYFDPEAIDIQQSLGQVFSFNVEGVNEFYFAGLNHAGNYYTRDDPIDLDSPQVPGTTSNQSYFFTWTFFNYYFTSDSSKAPSQTFIDDFVAKYGNRLFTDRLISTAPTQTPLSITKIGGGSGGASKYVELTDVQFTPGIATNGFASHYDHSIEKFVPAPEMKVDPANRNIALETTGAGALVSAGTMAVQSISAKATLSGGVDCQVTAATGTMEVLAVTGGIDLTAATTLTTTQNSMVSTSALTTKIETLGGKMEVLSAGDSDVKASGNIVVEGNGASVISTTQPLYLQSLTDGAVIQGVGGITNISGEGFSASAVNDVSIDTTTGDITLTTNGTQRLQVTNSGQLTSAVGYTPLTDPDLVTKGYTDGQLDNKVSKGGDSDPIPLTIGTNNAQDLYIVQNGDPVIEVLDGGSTSVNGTNVLSLSSTLGTANFGGQSANIYASGSGNKITFQVSDDPASFLKINTSTIKTAEQYALDITGTGNAIPNVEYVDSTLTTLGGSKVSVGGDTLAGALIVGTNNAQPLQLRTNATPAVTIETSGQIKTNIANYQTLVTSDDVIPNKRYVDDITNPLTTAVNTKVTKGGDSLSAPLIIGTNDLQPFQLRTNGTARFTLNASNGLLQSNTSGYEALILADNDITNKKYTDNKILAQPLEDHSNINTTANPGSDDLFLRWNSAVSAWDQDYVRIRVLPQLIGAPSVQGSVAIDDDDNKFTATILTGGAPARYVFTPMSVAISASGSPAYAGFNTAYSPYARLIGADMSGSGAGFTWPSVAGTPASASLVNKGTNIPAPSPIFANGTKQGVRLPGDAGPNPQAGFGIALSAPISTWTIAFVMNGLPDPAVVSSRLFTYNNNNASTTPSNLIQIMNGSTLHNRQIINGVSSIWPIASANSTITQATGNTTIFVFQYDSTRITDRYQVWKANATSLTSMVTSAVVISQPSISQWQVNGDNISACGMDIAEVIFWNNYQTSNQIDVWTNTLLEEYGARISGASYERILAPTASDDRNSGHRLGSQWFDTTNDKAYVCIDDAVGSAIWKETTKEITRDLNDVSSAVPTDRQGLMWMSSMNHYMPMLMKMPIGEIFGGGTQAPTTYALTLTTQNVWYEVAYTGATLVTNNSDFVTPNFDQPSPGRIRWIDAVLSPLFHTAFSASVSVGSANQSFEIALGLNGGTTIPSGDAAIIIGSVISKDFAVNNVTDSLAFHKVQQLVLNNTLSVYMRCTSSNNVTANFTNLNLVCVSANMW